MQRPVMLFVTGVTFGGLLLPTERLTMTIRRKLAVFVGAITVVALAPAAPAHAAVGDINTVAGNAPTCGYSGDAGPAIDADLGHPQALALDADGNLYIADFATHRIRKVDHTTGFITTVAGNGTYGDGGDGDLAINAQLRDPADVAVDTAGNLYIADNGNHRIRKVDHTTGFISTIAGTGTAGYSGDSGLAINAELHYPTSVSLDAAGNIYLADVSNNVVRKITAATGYITTVAGNGTGGYSGDSGVATSAQMNSPQEAIVDTDGNLYIADSSNNRIRKVDHTTGYITTIAGNGTAGYSGDGDPATDAQINYPGLMALDADGNLFFADYSNHRIRKVDKTGIITTVAGNGTAGSDGDAGAATAAQLNNPWGIEFNTTGDLFIAEYEGCGIRKVTGLSAPFTLPPTGANTDGLVWIALAMLGAGSMLITTRRLRVAPITP
ncbi:MAG: hypothetical protein F2795_01105 [Actinobacteria bacterium]|nr:hypothetical protein [Actinomycetota bacterium]